MSYLKTLTDCFEDYLPTLNGSSWDPSDTNREIPISTFSFGSIGGVIYTARAAWTLYASATEGHFTGTILLRGSQATLLSTWRRKARWSPLEQRWKMQGPLYGPEMARSESESKTLLI